MGKFFNIFCFTDLFKSKLIKVASLLLCCSFSDLYAETLENALASGYVHDGNYKILKERFLQVAEEFPTALSDFLPKVDANVQFSNHRLKTTEYGGGSSKSTINEDISQLSIKQSLFSGGSGMNGLKRAKSSYEYAKAQYYSGEQELLMKHIEAYLSCLSTKEKYEAAKVTVSSNRKQLDSFEVKFKLGESTKTELESAKANLAKAEADETMAEANFQVSLSNFNKLFNLDAHDIEIPLILDDVPNNLDDIQKIAAKNNFEIIMSYYAVEVAKFEQKIASAALFPKADISFSTSNDSKRRSPRASNRTLIHDLQATLSVNVPIFSRGGAEYSAIRRAKSKINESIMQYNEVKKSAKFNSKIAWENFNATKVSLVAVTKALEAAQIAYDSMLEEFRLGSKTILDVIRAEDTLSSIRGQKIDASKERMLAYYRLKLVMGDLTIRRIKLPVNSFDPDKAFASRQKWIIGWSNER